MKENEQKRKKDGERGSKRYNSPILSDLLDEECICIRQCHSFSLWPAEAILVNGRKLDARTVEKLVHENILEWKEDKAQLTDYDRNRLETFDRITIDRRKKKG